MKKFLTAFLCLMLLPCMAFGQGNLKRKPTKSTVGNNKQKVQTKGNINGHEFIDLGLPSKLKWATCNIGATKPAQSGNLYNWGSTDPDTPVLVGENTPVNISGNVNFDAARASWGATWRLPTFDEWKELIICCDWKWSELNGTEGYKVIGPKGTSIFLPVVEMGYGAYWSSIADKETDGAYEMLFDKEDYDLGLTVHSFFCNIRAVSN